MAERRPLVEGLKNTAGPERSKEEQFIYGGPEKPSPPPAQHPPGVTAAHASTAQGYMAPNAGGERKSPAPAGMGRVPLSARIRPELANALKRASLERQLSGLEPNSVQDIVEAALEPWLRSHGHLS